MDSGRSTNVADEQLVFGRQAELDSVRAWMLGAAAALMGVGIVLVYSASAVRAEGFGWSLYFVAKQLRWMALGAVAMLAAWHVDYRRLARLRWLLLVAGLGVLAGVLIPGVGAVVNGARRWYRVAGYSIQPSEAAKVLLVAALAAFLSRVDKERPWPFRRFAGMAALATAAAGLIAVEPDLGTGLLVGTALMAMVFAAGAPIRHLLLAGAAGAALFWRYEHLAARFAYVWERIAAWRVGGSEGKAYHAWISVQSLKSGQLYGMHPGQGWAKLGYLPEAHTDFIFSVAGQELGLVGAAGIVLAFAVIVVCGMRLVRLCPDLFGQRLAFGLTLMLGLQAAIHVAVVTAATPTKGISLPFVSFGGSGLVCSMAMLGLLASITRHAYAAHLGLIGRAQGGSPWAAHLLGRLIRRPKTPSAVR